MSRRFSIVSVVAAVLTLAAHLGAGAAPPAAVQQRAPATPGVLQQPAAPAPQPKLERPVVLKAEQLTKEQFQGLPDSALIGIKGTVMTAGELRRQMEQRVAESLAKAEAEAAQAKARFEAKRAKFLQEQKARLNAQNAKALADLPRLRQQAARSTVPAADDALHREAKQLLERAKTATPAEQVQIERRAGELLRQLQQGQQ